MESKYSYKFAPKAKSDLDAIIIYIEQELSNPKAAEDFVFALFEKINSTTAFPDLGQPINNEFIIDQTLRKFFIGNYIVFYKSDKKTETIIIIRIVYGRRDINAILKSI